MACGGAVVVQTSVLPDGVAAWRCLQCGTWGIISYADPAAEKKVSSTPIKPLTDVRR